MRTIRALAGAVTVLAMLLTLLLPLPVIAKEKPRTISSLSAVLYEPVSGRFLYEKDADTRLPMASTTKLMTALIAAEQLPPDAVVTVPPQAVLVEGSSMGLRGGDRLTVRDLITGLLLTSGNDAANALALLCSGSLPQFAARMNERAETLGMVNTLFVTPSGLDEGGHGSTARDMALLGAAVLKNEELSTICSRRSAVIHIGDPPREVTVTNHNRLLSLYPYAVGMKTGYTVKSGKCLVSAARKDGVTLIAVSLNGGDYWNDHIALYEYGFSQVTAQPLVPPTLTEMAVAGGTAQRVTIKTTTPPAAILMQGETVTVQVRLPAFVWAPINEGETVGTVRYTAGERVVCELPVTAGETVAEAPPKPYIKKWQHWFFTLLREWIG